MTSELPDVESSATNMMGDASLVSSRRTQYEYKPHTPWSNVFYGVLMVLIIVLPMLVPGSTLNGLILFNMGLVLFIYILALIYGFRVSSINRRGKKK